MQFPFCSEYVQRASLTEIRTSIHGAQENGAGIRVDLHPAELSIWGFSEQGNGGHETLKDKNCHSTSISVSISAHEQFVAMERGRAGGSQPSLVDANRQRTWGEQGEASFELRLVAQEALNVDQYQGKN